MVEIDMPLLENNRLVLVSNIVINEKNEILLLFRKDHRHYETPGGKPEASDCVNPDKPTQEDFLRAANRELREEVGADVRVKNISLFVRIEFDIPDGRKAVAYKYKMEYVSGKPVVNEPERFSRVDWLPLANIETFPLSPDLKALIPQLKTLIRE